MKLERIDSRERLEELRPAWSALWDRCPGATPFQSPEWLLPWWDVFAPGCMESIALHDGDRLAGLAPLYRAEDGVARFIGAGISDYLDVLAEPAFESDLAAAVFSLREADLTDLPAASPLLVSPPVPAEPCAVCPALTLPARPGYNLRRNLRRYGARLDGICGQAALDQWPEYLSALFELIDPTDPRVPAFHRTVAPGFAARGWLSLWGLRLEGSLRAVIYAFLARKRAYFYLTGYDPALARFGPGTLLLAAVLAHLAAEYDEADFLRGNESYKYHWGAQDRWTQRLRLAR